MTQFNCINDIINYIPNCIICKKTMFIKVLRPKTNKFYALKPHTNNDELTVHYNDNNFIINKYNNCIIKGAEFFKCDDFFPSFNQHKFIDRNHFTKICKTCPFDIEYDFYVNFSKNIIEKISIKSEIIRYYDRNHKEVFIFKNYENNGCHIYYQNKYISKFNLDLSKYQSHKSLTKKIKIISIFE